MNVPTTPLSNKSAAMIIRLHYEPDDPRFEWRFIYFARYVLPRILRQTYSKFDICIRCNPAHVSLFKALSPRITTFQVRNEHSSYKKQGRKTYFYDFVPWSSVIGLPKYDVQMGLDSDDLISPDYVAKVMDLAHRYREALHITFQPQLFRLRTRTVEPFPLKFTPTKGSAYMALSQPDKRNYHFIYEQSHLTLGQLAKRSIVLPIGDCWCTVHDFNESTGK